MSKIINYILANQWAVSLDVLRNGIGLIERHAAGIRATGDEVAAVIAHRERIRGMDDEGGAERRLSMQEVSRPWDGALLVQNEEDQQRGYYVNSGIAIVPMEGVFSRYASLVNGASSPRGTSMQAMVNSLKSAGNNGNVKAIVLEIDSPGGTVAGTEEVAALVASGGGSGKPVVAWAAYLMCSAAYWIGSQAEAIVANETALVGNIGVYTVLEDTSVQAAAEGRKVHVVKAGAHKAIGVDGAPVTESQLAVVQDEITGVYRTFVRHAARGRGMSESAMMDLADGRAHSGQAAVLLNLADQVGTLTDAVALAAAMADGQRPRRKSGG